MKPLYNMKSFSFKCYSCQLNAKTTKQHTYMLSWLTDWLTPWSRALLISGSLSACQEFPHILWSLKFHCLLNGSLPLAPNLSQINLVHAFVSWFFKTHFNTLLPSVASFSKFYLSFRLFHLYCFFIYFLPPDNKENIAAAICSSVVRNVSTRHTLHAILWQWQ